MEVVINVTQGELIDMDMDESELIVSVIIALDNHRDYVGYGVSVVIDDDGVVY